MYSNLYEVTRFGTTSYNNPIKEEGYSKLKKVTVSFYVSLSDSFDVVYLNIPKAEKPRKSYDLCGFDTVYFLFGDPLGTRTQDPYIKSVLLYQLS